MNTTTSPDRIHTSRRRTAAHHEMGLGTLVDVDPHEFPTTDGNQDIRMHHVSYPENFTLKPSKQTSRLKQLVRRPPIHRSQGRSRARFGWFIPVLSGSRPIYRNTYPLGRWRPTEHVAPSLSRADTASKTETPKSFTVDADAVVLPAPDGCPTYLQRAVEHSLDHMRANAVLAVPCDELSRIDLVEWCATTGRRVHDQGSGLDHLLIENTPPVAAA